MKKFALLTLEIGIALLSPFNFVAAQDQSGEQSGAIIQMTPIMAPVTDDRAGLIYMPIVLRVTLAAGTFERQACFSIPILHEAILFHLYAVKLTSVDLMPHREEATERMLTDVARRATDSRLYSRVEIVDSFSQPLDPRSQAMTNQCR